MIQRSSSVVCTSDALMEHAWGKLYSQAAFEAGITTEIADLTSPRCLRVLAAEAS